MSFISGSYETMSNHTYYYDFKKDHRNGSVIKSQWRLSCRDEFDLAEDAIQKQFNIGNVYYNVKTILNNLDVIGQSRIIDSDRIDLNIGKFVLYQNRFHGYPANHMNNEQDIPSEEVLEKMKQHNYINDRIYKRIQRGRPL